MKRHQLFIVVALAAGLAALAAVAAVRADSGGRTIRLVERGGTFTYVDNAPRGTQQSRRISAGDFSSGTVKLYDQAGAPAGSLHLVCIATVSGLEERTSFQCEGTAALADGTLAISGLIERRPDNDQDHIAVVGGTGAYAGARGTVESTSRPSGNAADDVVHLLP